jgi:hypothetical protein
MAVSEEKFLQIYGNVLTKTWGDPEFKERFTNETGDVLKEFGLDPGTSVIRLVQPGSTTSDESLCTAQSQVKLWNDGLESGSIDFYYPSEMPEGAERMELSAEQLEAVAGGGDCCCCCTPCCSCS